MTEEEWLTESDPTPMLEDLKGRASDRKLRLYTTACCRVLWHHFTHERSRQAVWVAERYADGDCSGEELARAHSMANDAIARWETVRFGTRVMINIDRQSLTHLRMRHAVVASQTHKPFLIGRLKGFSRDPELCDVGVNLVRDLFGNPFRPVTLDPRWRSETVVALATGIYAERAFDRMPILADALEEAGCDHTDILAHCRGDGPHVRGCWVVDLILGKS